MSDLSNEPNEISAVREQLRSVIEAEDRLAQAIFLCDHLAEKQSNNHPEGNDFVTHYVVPHGLWAAVLREKQNLRDALHKTLWPELADGPSEDARVVELSGDMRGENALRYLPGADESILSSPDSHAATVDPVLATADPGFSPLARAAFSPSCPCA